MSKEASSFEYGLKPSVIERLHGVFSAHPHVARVILYGSRAKGNFRNGSDIDLTVEGEAVSFSELLQITREIDDLLLPYQVDLSLRHQIENPDLQEHIERVGRVFYESAGHVSNDALSEKSSLGRQLPR